MIFCVKDALEIYAVLFMIAWIALPTGNAGPTDPSYDGTFTSIAGIVMFSRVYFGDSLSIDVIAGMFVGIIASQIM